ncbi:hypothetical protein AB0K93_14215 [Streptomyces sp. NPDC052676]
MDPHRPPFFGELLEITGISMSVNDDLRKVRFPALAHGFTFP